MSKSQRNKGAGYEREVCDIFTVATGRKIQRHIGQARDGGNDITVGSLVVECKRRKTLGTVEGWLLQAKAATVSAAQVPVVVARSDGGQSLAILSLADFLRIIDAAVLNGSGNAGETTREVSPRDVGLPTSKAGAAEGRPDSGK